MIYLQTTTKFYRDVAQKNQIGLLAIFCLQDSPYDAGYELRQIREGDAFHLPVVDCSIDVVAQNCRFNLKPGFAVSSSERHENLAISSKCKTILTISTT